MINDFCTYQEQELTPDEIERINNDPIKFINDIEQPHLRHYEAVKVKGRRDQYSNMKHPALIGAVNYQERQIIREAFPDKKDQATACRWVLRGLTVEKAIGKVKSSTVMAGVHIEEIKKAPLRLKKGIHYGKYIQNCENLECTHIAEEEYQFQVVDRDYRRQGKVEILPIIKSYKPFTLTPETNLSELDDDTLEQLDYQMSMEGESSDSWKRDAKFSRTRKNIKEMIYLRDKLL